MNLMIEDSLFEFYINNANQSFSGWDFSFLTKTDRMVDSPLDWGYASEVLKYIKKKKINTMLDMGTGGGEFLEKFISFPPNTYATEGYEPNISIAKNRLEPLGIKVIETKDNKLPFKDNFFDLIINRHQSFSFKEIKRVLKTEGHFITQQVGDRNCVRINEMMETNKKLEFGEWNLKIVVDNLKDNGFKIIKKGEVFPNLRFYDIGALVYYLKAVPWQIKDFSVDRYKSKLKKVHRIILKNDYFEVKEHRFFIIAKK